jgi:hypothetical protein
MSEFKGTPGSLSVSSVGQWYDLEAKFFEIYNDKNLIVGLCKVWSDAPEEALANARLFSAAPELLESLQEVMAALTKLGFDGSVERKAQAAINKALG